MATRVNIDQVSAALSDVLRKADELNIKRQTLMDNLQQIQQAIPIFERLVTLYESIPDPDSPRAKNYFRLAQQIASINDGWQNAYSDIRAEARLADAANAGERLTEEEAEAVGKLMRSSKLKEFVTEFDVENLERFRQFKELVAAVTDAGDGLSRKDAQTRRVAKISDIIREFDARHRKEYPVNDPYGTMADGDTLFGPNDAAPAGTPPNTLGGEVGKLYYSGGKWYRLEGISYDDAGAHKRWAHVTENAAKRELSPSAYAEARARGAREERAVASIEKTTRYIADLEPAGEKKKKEKEKKPSKTKQAIKGYGDSIKELARWASYGVATIGAIAGAAALIPKILNRVNRWFNTNKDVEEGYEKFHKDQLDAKPAAGADIDQGAKNYDAQVAEWNDKYGDYKISDIKGSIIPTYIADNNDVYGNDTVRRMLSFSGLTEGTQFKADILRAVANYKKTGDATFYSSADGSGETQLYHLKMFDDGTLPGLTDENRAALASDYEKFQIDRGIARINARPGWSPTGRAIVRHGTGTLLGLGMGYLTRNVKAAGVGYGAGYTLGVYAESARSDFRNGMSVDEYDKLSTDEKKRMAYSRFADSFISGGDASQRADIRYQLNTGQLPRLRDINNEQMPREMLGELIVSRGDLSSMVSDKYVRGQLQRVRETHALYNLRAIPQEERDSRIDLAAGNLVRYWEENLNKMFPGNKKAQDYFRKDIPTADELSTEFRQTDDFLAGGDQYVNAPRQYAPAQAPNVIVQNNTSQTNIVADDNIQQQMHVQ